MNNEDREIIRDVLYEVLENKDFMQKDQVREIIEDVISSSEWYSNKELFEKTQNISDSLDKKIENLSNNLEKTQRYVQKYNNLMGKITKTEEQAEEAKAVAEKLQAEKEASSSTRESGRKNTMLIVSIVMMCIGALSLLVTFAIQFL